MKGYTRNGGRWTEAKYNSFIKSAIRGMSLRWPVRYDALRSAQVGIRKNVKSGRDAMHYRCAICGEAFPGKEVHVDHLQPIVPVSESVDWNTVISNALCELEGLQVLCKPCHKIKSKEENDERRAIKRAANS